MSPHMHDEACVRTAGPWCRGWFALPGIDEARLDEVVLGRWGGSVTNCLARHTFVL
jgi:hypothetical protein